MNKNKKIKLLVGFICLLISTYLAFDMMDLYENRSLWGQRVLWFWIFLWAGVLCILGEFVTTLPQANRLLLASCASGLLLAGGFMPMPTFFLMFIGFVPLLWVEDVISKARKDTSKWTVSKFAFNAFFIWNILSTWWIQNSSFGAGILGNALNAVFMTIPFVFYHVTKKRMGRRAGAIGFVSYWLTFEIGHLTWDLSWPWLTLGNSFASFPSIIQWYEFTGVFGGSLWILFINILAENALIDFLAAKKEGKADINSRNSYLIKPFLAVLIPIFISLGLYYTHIVETEKSIEVVSVQPNYEPHYQKFNVSQKEQFANLMELTKSKVTENTAYVLFPETSFRGIQADKLKEASIINDLKSFVGNYPNLNLVVGLNSYIRYQEGDKRPDHVYTYCNGNLCQYIDSHNSAIQLNNETEEIPYYIKSKLVPGAESMPYIGDFEIFKSLILDMGGAPGLRLGIQEERSVFSSKHGKVAPLICYESIYGDFVTDYVKMGAEALFVITNDGWWDNTIGHRQHMYLSSLRAIENRRYVVRSANTGVSCFINSRGDIYNPSNYDEVIAMRDMIFLHEEQTFYTRYGDLIGRVSILLTAYLLLSILSNGLRNRGEL
jgi:apolipoprotein N-acyltransferase